MPNLRPSSSPLYDICGQALRTPVSVNGELPVVVDPESEYALLGSALHLGYADIVVNKEPDADFYFDQCARGQSRDEFDRLLGIGRWMWENTETGLKRYFGPTTVTEVHLRYHLFDDWYIDGHLDVYDPDQGRFVDWKTGRKTTGYWPQLKSYSILAGECKRDVWGALVYTGSAQVDSRIITVAEQIEFRDRLIALIKDPNPKYVPNERCKWCPRRNSCEGREDEAKGTLMVLGQGGDPSLPVKQRLASAYYPVKQIESAVKNYNDNVRAYVEEYGYLLLPDGNALVLKEQTIKEVDPLTGFPIIARTIKDGLSRLHGDDEDTIDRLYTEHLREIVDVGKTKAVSIIRDLAPGTKVAAEKKLLAEIEEAGGFTERKQYRLTKVAADSIEHKEIELK